MHPNAPNCPVEGGLTSSPAGWPHDADMQARLRCPELPNIRVPDVHVVGGIVAQEIFDSTVADMVRLQKIKVRLRLP